MCSNCLEFVTCQLVESPHPLWLQNPAQNFPFSTGASTNLDGPWCVRVCGGGRGKLCLCLCVYLCKWCELAHSFLDRKNCAIQEPSTIYHFSFFNTAQPTTFSDARNGRREHGWGRGSGAATKTWRRLRTLSGQVGFRFRQHAQRAAYIDEGKVCWCCTVSSMILASHS